VFTARYVPALDIQFYVQPTHCTWGADKSSALAGRKQATATEDFDFHISYL
jgi:hypothetical protein